MYSFNDKDEIVSALQAILLSVEDSDTISYGSIDLSNEVEELFDQMEFTGWRNVTINLRWHNDG